MLRIVPEELLRVLQHDRETARRLQEARAGHDRKDDQHDVDGRLARLIAESERVDHETDSADHRESKSAVPYADNEADEEHNES